MRGRDRERERERERESGGMHGDERADVVVYTSELVTTANS